MSGKIVLPLPKDIIVTDDGAEFEVADIARYKTDPAVFVLTSDRQTLAVYFKDISQINGVMVELRRNDNTFDAIGKLKRKADLPQPDDIVVTKENEKFEVAFVRYHNKSAGLSKGVILFDKEKQMITLNDIIEIKAADGETQTFNLERFRKTYKPYFAV